ncbi:MIP/aquaporin family protein [Streptomyces sp. AP-93]|uniref:MIP/aquaporin family protein n=1 Tax=Streptomyces sp. AP-93 TaxID=2929048 RepID=UPI001FAFE532|nr:aquaporin [Streptomyces sp. AP-93]MCJ0869597.1 aquaporin [Streptomyces sp. AP-93]
MEENTYPQKLLAEMLGTAMLVFIGVGSVPATLIIGGEAPFTMADLGMISLAFATVVIALVYAIGHISGCQINPAITLALAVTKKMPWRNVPGYIAAQVAGAVLGSLAIVGVLGREAVDVGLGIASFGAQTSTGQGFFAEAVGTFILAFVVFGAIDRRSAGGFAGLAIGLAVFAIIIPIAPATAAAINPARVIGPMVTGQVFGAQIHWDQLPVYVIAEIAGAVAAGFLYAFLNTHRSKTAPAEVPAQPAPAAEGVLS